MQDFILETSKGKYLIEAKGFKKIRLLVVPPELALKPPSYLYSDSDILAQAKLHPLKRDQTFISILTENQPMYKYQEFCLEEGSTVCVEGVFQRNKNPQELKGKIIETKSQPLKITYGGKEQIMNDYNKSTILFASIGVGAFILAMCLQLLY